MILRDQTEFAGKRFEVTWELGGDLPPRCHITQVSGVCFAPDDRIVMISSDGNTWNIPGGHPENGESLEDALNREVLEEACCEVTELSLLGWQHVRDLQDNSVHYQMRYCCRVRVHPFEPRHEVTHRKLIDPDAFLQTLEYGHSVIAAELLRLANLTNEQMRASERGAAPGGSSAALHCPR